MSLDVQTMDTSDAEPQYDGPEEYRALSSAAVVAMILGLLSLTAMMDYWLVVVPAVGIIWGIVAIRQIRARSGELTGLPLAWIGLVLSLSLFFGGPAFAYYQDTSRIPPGFHPISYDDLQPNLNKGEVIPKSAFALDGQQVYIKGFVYAGSQNDGIKQFVLVRDAGTCCFGGNPKVTDRIVVALDSPGGIIYTKQIAHVAGVFRVTPQQEPGGLGTVYYRLEHAEMR